MNFRQKVTNQYEGENGKKYHQKHSVPKNAYTWVAKLRSKKISPFIKEDDTILEYGVGTGWNISEIKCRRRIGYDVAVSVESEVVENQIEFIKDINIIPDESIDVVICHHVLEHVSHPPDVLNEIKRKLKIDGKLLLFVPYEIEKNYRSYNPDEPNHHLYSWNLQTLGNLIERLDFKLMEGSIILFGYDRFSGVWANKLHIGEIGFRMFRRVILLINPHYEVFVSAKKVH